MKPEEEKTFDKQFDQLLSTCSPEIRHIFESRREEYKYLVDQAQVGYKASDDMLKNRLGPLYPFLVPQGKEIRFEMLRPRQEEQK
jgi:hypothetical protein